MDRFTGLFGTALTVDALAAVDLDMLSALLPVSDSELLPAEPAEVNLCMLNALPSDSNSVVLSSEPTVPAVDLSNLQLPVASSVL